MEKAGTGRRFLALMIDWTMCSVIVNFAGFEPRAFSILALFFIEVSALTALQQASAGQRILRMRVVDFTTHGVVRPGRVLLRTFLICLVLPAIFAREQRGLHDWVTNSIVVRA
jgi:uncharacterized RDD family membrane protein YckC